MSDAEATGARLRLAFDLFDAGVALMRQRLRRDRPDATSAEIESALHAWLATRPGAEDGDACGVPGRWPRRRQGT